MALAELQKWLLSEKTFRWEYREILKRAVISQFPQIKPDEPLYPYKPDWHRLLFCASVLAQSEDPYAQDVALRISQTALTDEASTAIQRDAAAVVLDELTNRRAIKLAVDRNFLAPAVEQRLGFSKQLDWTRREIENSLELHDGRTIYANGFQQKFWKQVNRAQWISASAPTSAGKSFIVTQWLAGELAKADKMTVVYVAPTRALIHQVERDVRASLIANDLTDVGILTIPFLTKEVAERTVLIFTQERLHYYLRSWGSDSKIDIVIVDEAHKIGDRHRGVLLQDVIEQISLTNPDAKFVFASPLSENPETLLSDIPSGVSRATVNSLDVTVNQNLLWLDPVRGEPGRWDLTLREGEQSLSIGSFQIKRNLASGRQRLAHLALATASAEGGVLVYANTASEAEKIAAIISRSLAEAEPHDGLASLIELAEATVHKQYVLAEMLRKGVACHYGNMPLQLRTEIEDLFRAGAIKYLVCTSTLVEGVNLPCRTLVVRNPKKGKIDALEDADFWNLAGRAGRWGTEFQGNIVCIDAKNDEVWQNGAPSARRRFKVERTTDRVLQEGERVIAFLRARASEVVNENGPELEFVSSYLAATALRYGTLSEAPWAKRIAPSRLALVDAEIRTILSTMAIPTDLISRHAGINPNAMSNLLVRLRDVKLRPVDLIPLDAARDDAVEQYARIFQLIGHHMSPVFGDPRRSFSLAITTCEWMRGFPIARIIKAKLRWHKDNKTRKKLDSVIRETLADIEDIARFHAPRLLACYSDVLSIYLREIGEHELAENLPDLTLPLEFGVRGTAQLTFMALGLSRSAALSLATAMAKALTDVDDPETHPPEFSESAVKTWFLATNLAQLEMPKLVVREAVEIQKRLVLTFSG